MSDNSNMQNDPTAALYLKLARGLVKATSGNRDMRDGAARASVALIQIMCAAAQSDDKTEYQTLCHHIAGVHANAKEQPEAFAASWLFWNDRFSFVSEKERPDFKALSAEDEEDVSDRREGNDNVNTAKRVLRFACSIAYAFVQSNVSWDKEHIRFYPKQPDKIAVSQDNALSLFGDKKEKAISKLLLGVMIDTYGPFNFKALAELGNAALVQAGVRKAPRKASEKITPIRDMATNVRTVLESADTKSLDKATRLTLHELLITIVDRLNDVDLGDGYIPTSVTASARDAAEAFILKVNSEKEQKIAELSAAIKKSVAA